MDLKEIQELIKFVAKSGATEVDLEIDNIKISIKSPAKKRRGEKEEATIIQHHPLTQATISTPNQSNIEQNIATSNINEDKNNSVENKAVTSENDNFITINSSMIGTFYRSSSPDKPPFISVGDEIKKGDIICIIEAMKLFNEIESEIDGKIIKVLVDDANPVEFDQPLFLIDPK